MKKNYIIILSILGLFILVTGSAYAFFWIANNSSTVENNVTAAVLNEVEFVHGPDLVIPDGGIYPGWVGIQEFSVNKPADRDEGIASYEISIDVNLPAAFSDWITVELYKTTTMSNSLTRVPGYLDENATNALDAFVDDSITAVGITVPDDAVKVITLESTNVSYSLEKISVDLSTMSDTKYYLVYRFNRDSSDQNATMGLVFDSTIELAPLSGPVVNDYKEDLLAGSDPVLHSGLLPINISDDGTVKIADTANQWYDYETKKWANAVVVNSAFTSREAGTIIPMDSIEQMYVWIPRYSYDANSIVSAQEAIDVTFVNKATNAHPAFTFGTDELSGIWVGKFELANEWGETEATPDVELVTKPNLNSAHDMSVSEFYNSVDSLSNKYGLSNDSDIHLIKNTEWGAVAYLSQSKYGVCNSDGTCTSKVVNNNYYYGNSVAWNSMTGCGGTDGKVMVASNLNDICPLENRWNTSNGALASTTNNITGIYDMAGGRFEYVMGSMVDSSGNFYSNNSGFASAPDSKYFDSYAYSTSSSSFSRGLPGDATVELNVSGNTMTSWNGDYASMLTNVSSWFIRGGNGYYESSPGIWYFNGKVASGNFDTSSRAVITDF